MFHLQGAPLRRPFTDWLADVDRQLVKLIGLDSGSMEDWPWRAEYDCGVSPQEAAEQFVEELRS